MRIIAGRAKGRRLRAPAGPGTRPMMDRAREALFSALGPAVVEARVLDLYAGSGSIGLEALSRGAAEVVFVERGRAALAALRANVEAVGLGGVIVAGDVGSHLAGGDGLFDLVFVDPPFSLPLASLEEVLALAASFLGPGGMVVVHRRSGTGPPLAPGLVEVSRRRYGDTEITVLAREEDL